MRGVRVLIVALAALAASGPWSALRASPRDVVVFAAASLSQALREIGDRFAARSGGTHVKLSLAASSTLAKQIENGAAADLFISADEAWMDYVEQRGLLAAGTRRSVLSNRLVLVVPVDRPRVVRIGEGGDWLAAFPAGRIATGDPAHVPAGKYARQALTRLGVWPEVEPRLARADNVRSALALVERGEAVAGIVYATDAAASRSVAIAATFPETAHEPISYPVALMRGHDTGAAQVFHDFLMSPEARAIFTRHGFEVR